MKKKVSLFLAIILMCLGGYYFGEESEAFLIGKSKGEVDGKRLAEYNIDSNLKPEYDSIKPLDREIRSRYSKELAGQDDLYIEEFISGYKIGHKFAYEETMSEKKPDKLKELDIGKIASRLGKLYGSIDGRSDFSKGRRMDFKGNMPRDREIINMFSLRSYPRQEEKIFIEEFKKSYELAYKGAYYEEALIPIADNIDQGKKDGESLGFIYGDLNGRRDFRLGKPINAERDSLSDRGLISKYNLNIEDGSYLEGFLEMFKVSYRRGYLEGFRQENNMDLNRESKGAYESGMAIGLEEGKIQANLDFIRGLDSKATRSISNESDLIKKYNLKSQPLAYMDLFTNGYFSAYKEGYDDEYKILLLKNGRESLVSEIIPLAGGEISSENSSLKLSIESGTYYKPVIANIKTTRDGLDISKNYTLASDVYNISITNPSGDCDISKPIKIALEYYGDFKGGIYVLEDGKWIYLSSKLEEGFIVAELRPNNLDSVTIALLIGKDLEKFHDIRGHWAKEEIEAYIRRGVINGYPDGSFKGDNYITRGEFLVLLSRVYDWDLPKDTSNNRYFADYKKFGYADREISYGYSKAYIIGYPDKHYRPNSNISYREVDIIMKRVLGDMNFSWNTYSEKIQYEKSVRSKSYDSMNNKITRAEFSYLLYKLNEKSY